MGKTTCACIQSTICNVSRYRLAGWLKGRSAGVGVQCKHRVRPGGRREHVTHVYVTSGRVAKRLRRRRRLADVAGRDGRLTCRQLVNADGGGRCDGDPGTRSQS